MVATPIFYATTAEGLKAHPAAEGDDYAGKADGPESV
jgi:hypothetical protein